MHTPDEKLRNGNPQYSLSELQLYEDTHKTTSERYADSYVGAACDALEEIISSTEEKITAGTITAADVTSLQDAIQVLQDTRHGGSTAIRGIGTQSGVKTVYGVDGIQRPATRKGLNIIRQADGKAYKVLQ